MIGRAIKSVLWKKGITQSVNNLYWKAISSGNPLNFLAVNIRYKNFPLGFEDEAINLSFGEQNALWEKEKDTVPKQNKLWWHQLKDCVIEVNVPCVLDPVNGIAIMKGRKLVEQSRHHPHMFPGVIRWLKYQGGFTPVKHLPEAIHVDGYAGDNYYHFFYDVLYPFMYLKGCGLPGNMPLYIGRGTYEKHYFQWLLQHNEWFRNLPWLVSDNKTFVKVDKLYKPIAYVGEKDLWLKVIALYNPPHTVQPTRRVFQYRASQFGRSISNMDEIKPILEKYGFEMVDTGDMTVGEQMQLFSETLYFIGIHGAGITNIIFTNHNKFSMLEILPGMLNTQYYWMANILGIKYDAVLTEQMNAKREFYLEPDKLERHIMSMLGEIPKG